MFPPQPTGNQEDMQCSLQEAKDNNDVVAQKMLRPRINNVEAKNVEANEDSSSSSSQHEAPPAREIMTRAKHTQKKTTEELVKLDAEIQRLQRRKPKLEATNEKKKKLG